MPLQKTSGTASYDAFGGGAAAVPNYIENMFSTYLYTGTGATQTITNNIDTTTYGGLTWIKSRSAATDHKLTDTARGVTKALISDTTGAQTTDTTGLTAFGTTGFTIGADANYNTSAETYASWTFRKQPKFFDVVTYTGTGSNTTISHNLGSVPGCIIVKRTDTTGGWGVYHNSLTSAAYRLLLNSAAIQVSDVGYWNSTAPTSAVFSIGNTADVNASGGTYVAYLFAHNAGGFGLTGTDNVISCGAFSTDGSGNATTTLGYEPQYIMYKKISGTSSNWIVMDNMRGFNSAINQLALLPNASNAEYVGYASANATGFTISGETASVNFIYIAIRRGPMKVPTDATKVFAPVLNTGDGSTPLYKSNTVVAPDFFMNKARASVGGWQDASRLTGDNALDSSSTAAEYSTGWGSDAWAFMNGLRNTATTIGDQYWQLFFKRAPGFFDVVCYTGTGSATTVAHNLGVAPELMIFKTRSAASSWFVLSECSASDSRRMYLESTSAGGIVAYGSANFLTATPTATLLPLGGASGTNTASQTLVACLFATCPGVSKVGSYTGNGITQTINCGFTGGARFVMIKRTDAAGDWYTYDTARGMTTLTDPYLLMNSTAAEAATLGSVTTVSTGFALNSAILAAINTSAATYIFLAIA
jgi:hypothetical protein